MTVRGNGTTPLLKIFSFLCLLAGQLLELKPKTVIHAPGLGIMTHLILKEVFQGTWLWTLAPKNSLLCKDCERMVPKSIKSLNRYEVSRVYTSQSSV